jgi:hypothetical protein
MLMLSPRQESGVPHAADRPSLAEIVVGKILEQKIDQNSKDWAVAWV